MKHVCCKCGALAVWMYSPASNRPEEERYYCDGDSCIKRGCSCNIIAGKEELDDQGRSLPCCEYDYNPDGYDK